MSFVVDTLFELSAFLNIGFVHLVNYCSLLSYCLILSSNLLSNTWKKRPQVPFHILHNPNPIRNISIPTQRHKVVPKSLVDEITLVNRFADFLLFKKNVEKILWDNIAVLSWFEALLLEFVLLSGLGFMLEVGFLGFYKFGISETMRCFTEFISVIVLRLINVSHDIFLGF